jgi:small subunit ribosomal protein S18
LTIERNEGMAEETRSAESSNGGGDVRSGPRPGPRRGGRSGGRRFQGKPKVCLFCAEKNQRIDYKQADVLRRFVNDTGKIRPRRQTGTCARHQRLLSVAIKRARHLALLPYTSGSSR